MHPEAVQLRWATRPRPIFAMLLAQVGLQKRMQSGVYSPLFHGFPSDPALFRGANKAKDSFIN